MSDPNEKSDLNKICLAINEFIELVASMNREEYDAKFPVVLINNDFENELKSNAAKFNEHAGWLQSNDGVINDESINKKVLSVIAGRIISQGELYQMKVGKNAVSDRLLISLKGLGEVLNNISTPDNRPRPSR